MVCDRYKGSWEEFIRLQTMWLEKENEKKIAVKTKNERLNINHRCNGN